MQQRFNSAVMNLFSNSTLCATKMRSCKSAATCSAIAPNCGLPSTISSVMPVSSRTNGVIGCPGSTSEWYVSTISEPSIRAIPISIILLSSPCPPVVSRSTTANFSNANYLTGISISSVSIPSLVTTRASITSDFGSLYTGITSKLERSLYSLGTASVS